MWSTRIAAVATDDAQQSKFARLLGMNKKSSDGGETSAKSALAPNTDVSSVKQQLDKMTRDLDTQYGQVGE
jgi:hypothetical protein